MRGRVAVLLLLAFSISLQAAAQCSYSLGFSGQTRATYLDVAVDGNDLWTATSYGLQLFDRSSDPPTPLTSIAIPGITRVVRVAAGTVYAGSGSRIYAVRKSGKSLTIVGNVDAGATVNDLVLSTTHMYAGTASGIVQFDLLNPTAPSKTPATFATSAFNATSLAYAFPLLYAADGDNSVEIFDITVPTLPLKTGTVASLTRSVSVDAAPGRLYVSDGFSTDVFVVISNTYTKASNYPAPALAFSSHTGDVAFVAGSDRRFRAVDWTTPGSPVDLFASDVVPNGGNVNRASAMVAAGNRLYVAGGDAGLETWDLTGFSAPFPIRSYSTGPADSTLWVDGKLYVARSSAGIVEYTKNSFNYLIAARQWDSRVHVLHDGGNGFLLTSTGSQLTFWTLVSTIPTLIASATFPTPITAAAASGLKGIVILADKSVWTVDLATESPTPQRVTGISATAVARSGSAVVLANVQNDGTTALSWYPTANFTAPDATRTLAGVSTTGVALSGSKAAIFTFAGINTHDFSTATTRVFAGSSGVVARELAFAGNRLVQSVDTTLNVWDLASEQLTRTITLPLEPQSLSIDGVAAMATERGVMTAAFEGTSRNPQHIATRNGNVYYTDVAIVDGHLYALDSRGIDIYTLTHGFAPAHVGAIRASGITDFAVSGGRIFTLTSGGVVSSYSTGGAQLNQISLNEGLGAGYHGISAAGDALWVSISRGCLSGNCEKKTRVIDPLTLAVTSTLEGGVIEVVVAAGRAWAVFDLPAEVRNYDIANPRIPAQLASTAAAGSRTPVSVAYAAGTLQVLGEKLYSYPTSDLLQRAESLSTHQADPSNGVLYTDQSIRIDSGCALIAGRQFSPQFFTTGQWGNSTPASVPSPVRAVSQGDGRLVLLTDHSIEVWSNEPADPAPRKRAVGR